MISIFIMIVIAIALSAAAGFGILTLLKGSETALLIQRNQVRIDTVVNSIRSYVRVDGKRVLVPLALLDASGGVPAELKTRLPSLSPFTTTTWGAPIVYCPAAPSEIGAPPSGTTSGILVNDLKSGTETYDVEITKLGGVAYVSAGGPGDEAFRTLLRDKRIVALVISPDPSGETVPRCEDVSLGSDGATFIADGGSVVAVYDLPRLGDGHVFVLSPNGSLPSGFPAGSNVVRSLIDAATNIRNYRIRDATVFIKDGSTSVPAADLSELVSAASGRSIRLTSNNGGSLAVEAVSGPEVVLPIDGTFELSKVSLSSSAADIGFRPVSMGRLVIKDATIGFLRNTGGDVTLRGNVSVSPAHSLTAQQEPISSIGGRVMIDNVPSVVNSAIASVGVFARGGDVTILGNTNMTLAAGAKAFRTEMGGRILPTTTDAVVTINTINGTTSVPIESIVTFGTSASEGQIVSVSGKGTGRSLVFAEQGCADGTPECTASCIGESVIAWGECSTSNNSPLSGFGAAPDGRSWTCRWSDPLTGVSPKAKAVCSKLP